MSYRYMRIMVFFDLPTESLDDKRNYRKFRKFLIASGFLMMQESVYCKLALNQTVANTVAAQVRKNVPPEGKIQMMIVTERQFARMEYLVGERQDSVIENDETLVIL